MIVKILKTEHFSILLEVRKIDLYSNYSNLKTIFVNVLKAPTLVNLNKESMHMQGTGCSWRQHMEEALFFYSKKVTKITKFTLSHMFICPI